MGSLEEWEVTQPYTRHLYNLCEISLQFYATQGIFSAHAADYCPLAPIETRTRLSEALDRPNFHPRSFPERPWTGVLRESWAHCQPPRHFVEGYPETGCVFQAALSLLGSGQGAV